jgi:hypothetical protein
VAGKTPHEAVRVFVRPIQDALGCFLTGKVTADCHEEGSEGVLALNRGEPTVLNGGSGLSIEVSLRYVVIKDDDPARGPWKVSTRGWMHELTNKDGREVAAWHWHPVSKSHVLVPHLHVPPLKAHYPTGRVMIEDVLAFAADQGAEPNDPKTWAKVDQANRDAFRRGATWGVNPT